MTKSNENKSVTHELKTWPTYVDAIFNGIVSFIVRENDRDYQVGDILLLRGYCPDKQEYDGSFIIRRVTYVMSGGRFGIEDGHCVIGLGYPNPNSVEAGSLLAQALIRIKELEEVLRWIPVTEALPEFDIAVHHGLFTRTVQVYSERFGPFMAWLERGDAEGNSTWVTNLDNRQLTDITHWRKLDMPPIEG